MCLEILDDLALYHVGIGNDDPRAGGAHDGGFELEQVAVLRLKPADPTSPLWLEAAAAFEPGAVDAIAGAVGIALPDTLQRIDAITTLARAGFAQAIGKSARAGALDTDYFPLPGRFGPVARGVEHRLMAGGSQAICQAEQVPLRPSAGGVTAADKGDFHSGMEDKGANRGEIEHLAIILQPPFFRLP